MDKGHIVNGNLTREPSLDPPDDEPEAVDCPEHGDSWVCTESGRCCNCCECETCEDWNTNPGDYKW